MQLLWVHVNSSFGRKTSNDKGKQKSLSPKSVESMQLGITQFNIDKKTNRCNKKIHGHCTRTWEKKEEHRKQKLENKLIERGTSRMTEAQWSLYEKQIHMLLNEW